MRLIAGLVLVAGGHCLPSPSMLVVGAPAGPRARCALADRGGVLTMAAGNYWMSQMNLDISPGRSFGRGWC